MTTATTTFAPRSGALPQQPFRTDDASLTPIAEKVLAGERLEIADGLALYRSHDILAVGWMAKFVPKSFTETSPTST